MKTTVIGGAGQMGGWLIQHFKALGHSVIASDLRNDDLRKMADTLDFTPENDNITAVLDSNVVIISVPIDQISSVIREISPHMRQNSILCEISSIKQNLPDELIEVSEKQIRPLCIHPMFGPGSGTLFRRIVLIPIYDMQSERSLVGTLFPGCHIICASAEEHDRAMAFIISLPYFVNMILASVLIEEDLALLQELSGTTFAVQLMLMGSVMFQSLDLHVALHRENKHVPNILKQFQSRFAKGISLLSNDFSGFGEFYTKVKENVEQNVNLEEKYKEMYRVLEIMIGLETGEVDF